MSICQKILIDTIYSDGVSFFISLSLFCSMLVNLKNKRKKRGDEQPEKGAGVTKKAPERPGRGSRDTLRGGIPPHRC
jgi:hypothetical protein